MIEDNATNAASSQPNEEPDRMAEPVDDEQAPRLSFPVIGIGASAGGLEAFLEFFKALPPDTGMAFVLIQHLPPDRESLIAEILSKHTAMPVHEVEDGMAVDMNHVYVIRPGRTLTIRNGALHLGEPLEKPGHRRPVDDFFRSLAEEQRERAIAVVMSGMGSNGSAGAQAIKAVGGVCVAQDPESAKYPSMPRCLIDAGLADFILRPDQIPAVLQSYAHHPYAKGTTSAEETLQRERKSFSDVIALLRTRSRQDFSGYKQPTVLRRIQRRMGLRQILELDEYVTVLRQNPSEATALADDLVIHVTGFFRDPHVWESLRQRVIEPMVAERESGSQIRAWVTACSSGEEAYTLAMLLSEAAEAAHKTFEIKVFATDLADRMLNMARSGTYAHGIEAEVSPERLERFFEKDELTYRVKKELRELIIFSPQNVLQDPPFSRLDICTCRNLLIYLEPVVQRRVLSLLHFGLREGGGLLLGNSETIAGAEEIFEAIDKKLRIYRRVGPTRPASIDFAWGGAAFSNGPGGEAKGVGMRPVVRLSIAHLAERTMLERFTPPAVVVDRNHRVVFFHGDTAQFLIQPPGEPTRELFALVRESVRGAVRVALHRAMAENATATIRDGFIDVPEGRVRVIVTVAPLGASQPEPHFLVSFEQRTPNEFHPDHGPLATNGDPDDHQHLIVELQRVRDERQIAVEELQTSNEELKALNEEVTSVNEELQSTNEELETSREELQSLNEELTTVNAQLQAKMEELEATSNDLSSLLASTDIAVVFLDTRFRIRRFTPTVLDLFELIPSDLGRPLSDLSPKFADPDLLDDARAVLAKLVPIEREVACASGQRYVRRILPYRTADNRIDGVVLTFIDVTRQRLAEQAHRESDLRYRHIVQAVTEYAIFMIDVDGRIAMWDAGAERVLGFNDAEAVGQPLELLYTPEDRAARVPEQELATARKEGQTINERWHVRKGGQRFWGSGIVTAMLNDSGELRGYVKVMRDNTDRRVADEQLQDAHRAAQTANEAKDQFLATVSHELRTPLSAILLWTHMLGSQTPDEATLQEAVASIAHSAEAQKQLIDDLLDSSRISAGKLRLNVRPTDLGNVVRLAVDAIAPTAQAKGVDVQVDLDAECGRVLADPDRLQQVVWNLLTNAVKFTPTNGRVDVKMKRRDKGVEILVQDTGIGIDPEFLPKIFSRFQQAEGVNSRTHGGLGLGLAITKQLVELHGGTIDVASQGLGHGAVFIVRLPLAKLVRERAAKAVAAGSAPLTDKALAGKRILLVEDSEESALALTRVLQTAGASVMSASSATEGLARLADAPAVDVIVSDIAMPEIDGYAFMRSVRELESAKSQPHIPAIALSAFTRSEDRIQATAAGFQAHLPKPVSAANLTATILMLTTPAS